VSYFVDVPALFVSSVYNRSEIEVVEASYTERGIVYLCTSKFGIGFVLRIAQLLLVADGFKLTLLFE
jgi:hypothetical protein